MTHSDRGHNELKGASLGSRADTQDGSRPSRKMVRREKSESTTVTSAPTRFEAILGFCSADRLEHFGRERRPVILDAKDDFVCFLADTQSDL